MDKLNVSITPTFAGFVLAATPTGSANDPLAQKAEIKTFDKLDDLLADLPRFVRQELERLGVVPTVA